MQQVGLIAFGVAALLYLVTEELLVEVIVFLHKAFDFDWLNLILHYCTFHGPSSRINITVILYI